jgi:hypothetical protein
VINLIFTIAFASYISVGGHVGGLIGGVASMFLLTQVRGNTALSAAGLCTIGVIAVVVAYTAI